ncbi:phage distal tail protein [Robertmurraya siralis]|uniref:phage distal tail protein n=1 Tax=Robertmurraya siralis TaxID=77777 RepID=UPI0010F67548|nr:phage tail domain-containing protein [Robertmurraya siralis]
MLKNIKITNSRGDQFEFDSTNRLTNGLDLSGLLAIVNRVETNAPGTRYQNTKIDEREFDLEFKIRQYSFTEETKDDKRSELYKVFNPNYNPVRIDFETSNEDEYYLMAELLGTPIMPPDKSNNNAVWQRCLLQFVATDPFIYTKNEKMVDIAFWVSAFEFPLEIPEEGIEMGYREPSLIANVFNDGQESTGMMIRFKALGTLRNPSLINVNTYETLKLNTTMQGGDVIWVSTYQRRKSVTLIRNGVSTNIFNSLTLDSKFLQLNVGDNLFRYDVEEGPIENLEVSMRFAARLLGV